MIEGLVVGAVIAVGFITGWFLQEYINDKEDW